MSASTTRQIRVFISSTFRDMQTERDHLVKFIFPQLRKLCEERGVTWSEVDLRWGITTEQSAEGQVLPICLQEIQRCKPYFIGLLGERYGWIPERIDPAIIEREPWLAQQLDHSVTELEILYGVLNDPMMEKHAFFYFRDPNAIPDERKDDYLEMPSQEEIDRFGKEEANKRANSRKEKLSVLKERIRKSRLPLKEGFQNPQQLGTWVLADMTAIIEQMYPEGSQPTPLKLEGLAHESFAISRARVYIGGEKYFRKIDEHLSTTHLPLVVLGESGIGKSALLANWGLKYRKENPDTLVLMHFVGASAASGDWAAMLRRFLSELQERFDIEGEIPSDANELREVFSDWLYKAGQKGQVLLIIDALNQLEDKQGAPELTWLPMTFPDSVQVVISTLPGKSLDSLNKRGYPVLCVEPLTQQEQEEFIRIFLEQYSKQLDAQQTRKIMRDPALTNPLGLRILLDELRQFGSYEHLDETIQGYLNADSITGLLEMVFERCENDFEVERPGLVKDTLCYIWAARQGLSEAELLDLLGKEGKPLVQHIWSPLHLALEGSLLERSGLIGFSHEFIRQAVEKHYLANEAERNMIYKVLADYFENILDYPQRKVIELPWQLQRMKDWDRLYAVLAAPAFFMAQWRINQYDLYTYWTSVEENSDLNRVQAYQDVIKNPLISGYKLFLVELSLFLMSSGYLEDAMTLFKKQERIGRAGGDLNYIQNSLGHQALILKTWGKLDEAMIMQKEKERICNQLGNTSGVQAALGNQAIILMEQGRLDEAMKLFKEQENTYRKMGDKDGLQRSLGNQALILKTWGKFDEAMAMQKEKELICRELGNKDGIQISLGNQALILKNKGKLDGAAALFKEQEQIVRELNNKDALQQSLGYQAQILHTQGKSQEAMEMHKEKERICRELGNLNGIQESLGDQAIIMQKWGKIDESMSLLVEKEKICLQLKSARGLCLTWVYQGTNYLIKGDKSAALKLIQKAYDLAKQNGYQVLAQRTEKLLEKFS